jgi:hypothetical protein
LSSGTLNARDQFCAKRAALFQRPEQQLEKMAAFGASLRNKGTIKKTLGLSTESYLNAGEIAGYADKVAGGGKAANLIKKERTLELRWKSRAQACQSKKHAQKGERKSAEDPKLSRVVPWQVA